MWIETSNEVFAAIFAKHKKQLKVHSSFIDLDSYYYTTGNPELITEWGFDDAKKPLIKTIHTKENKEQKKWDINFFIYYD